VPANSKVLLVDDSKFLRMANERALSRAGYEVSTAADGEEALKVANDKLPDVILLDLGLPDMDGIEVTRRLRRASWPVEVHVVRTDLWDVFHALASLRAIFEAEGRTDRTARDVVPLRVNVSTGTKITAIAGTLACMLWNGTPYYAQVSRAWYSDRTPRVGEVHDVVERVEPVGVYELRAPSRELVEVLDLAQRTRAAAGGGLVHEARFGEGTQLVDAGAVDDDHAGVRVHGERQQLIERRRGLVLFVEQHAVKLVRA